MPIPDYQTLMLPLLRGFEGVLEPRRLCYRRHFVASRCRGDRGKSVNKTHERQDRPVQFKRAFCTATGMLLMLSPETTAASQKTVVITCPVSIHNVGGSAHDSPDIVSVYTFEFRRGQPTANVTSQFLETGKIYPTKTVRMLETPFMVTFIRDEKGTKETFAINRETLAISGQNHFKGRVWWIYAGTCNLGKIDTSKNKF